MYFLDTRKLISIFFFVLYRDYLTELVFDVKVNGEFVDAMSSGSLKVDLKKLQTDITFKSSTEETYTLLSKEVVMKARSVKEQIVIVSKQKWATSNFKALESVIKKEAETQSSKLSRISLKNAIFLIKHYFLEIEKKSTKRNVFGKYCFIEI